MRSLTTYEKEILYKISLEPPGGHMLLPKLLERIFFTEKDGRALILQTIDKYAVFYIKVAAYDSDQQKHAEIAKFTELLSLLHYLAESRYITLYNFSEEEKSNDIYCIQDGFITPRITSGNIQLNEQGLHSVKRESILDHTNTIIYRGVRFDSTMYDLILRHTTGYVHLSPALKELLQYKPVRRKKSSEKYLLGGLAATIFAFAAISCYLFYQLTRQYEERVDNLVAVFNDIQSSQEIVAARVDSVLQTSLTDHRKSSVQPDQPGFFYGIDVSKYNGNISTEIDVSDSITFTICKATEGAFYRDPRFEANWTAIKEKGLMKGAYHFYRVDDDPKKQAINFLHTLHAVAPTDLTPIVDIEEKSLSGNHDNHPDRIQNDLLVFLDHIEQASGRIPMIYTNVDFANQYLKNDLFSKYPLWLAEYTSDEHPRIPYAWREVSYKIWQKSDRYTIKSERVDFDVFYGRRSDLCQ